MQRTANTGRLVLSVVRKWNTLNLGSGSVIAAADPQRSARKKRIEIMPFTEEPAGYEKTILSDLQGAWSLLRQSVLETGGFEGWDRVLFHIDEAMSWESVRNLKRMPSLLLIIRNLCTQGKAPQEVIENIREVDDILKEVLSEISN